MDEAVDFVRSMGRRGKRITRTRIGSGGTHRNPAIIIQVTDGEAEVLRDDGFGDELHAQGEFSFQEPGGTYRVHNAGDAPVGVVISEVRKSQ